MQRSLDSLLADAARSPVGTTGTTENSGNTIMVDRARLVQLRQQLDALMAAVEKRR